VRPHLEKKKKIKEDQNPADKREKERRHSLFTDKKGRGGKARCDENAIIVPIRMQRGGGGMV